MPGRILTEEEQQRLVDYEALRTCYERLETMLIDQDKDFYLGRVALMYYEDTTTTTGVTTRVPTCRTFGSQAAALLFVQQFLVDKVYFFPVCCIGGTDTITSVFE